MIAAVLVLCAVALANANPVLLREQEFEDFKVTHGKVYSSEQEELQRLEIFSRNLQEIEEHNRQYEQGLHTWYMGVNQFTDMTTEEFTSYLTKQGPPPAMDNVPVFKSSGQAIPASLDWRQSGIVTDVKQQGACGSCWSFSTTGAIEGAHAKATGKLISLSEQNLVDCVTANSGCIGGYMTNAYAFIVRNGGIATEAAYPYLAVVGQCQQKGKAVSISSYNTVAQDETSLQQAVAKGPVSVTVDARDFKNYKGGVYYHQGCDPTSMNHAVLAIGYGNDGQSDFWLLKNSWGNYWGEKGYMRLTRNKNNHCGVANMASFPIV